MNILPSSLPDVRRPEVNIPTGTEIVRTKDGRVLKRVTYNTGNRVETLVFPGAYEAVPGAKPNKVGELLMQARV